MVARNCFLSHSFAVRFVCMYFVDFYYYLRKSINHFIVFNVSFISLCFYVDQLSSTCSILPQTKSHFEEIRPLSKLVLNINIYVPLYCLISNWKKSDEIYHTSIDNMFDTFAFTKEQFLYF